MSSSVITTSAPPAPDRPPQGYCSQCHKVWILKTDGGTCPYCHHSSYCQLRTKPHQLQPSRRRRRKQESPGNGYDHLAGAWLTYYNVASHFSHKAQAQDREDLLHDIILTLASVERNNGHKPFTEAVMYRIASRTVADYWRAQYKLTMGLTCCNCSKAQRQKCRKDWLYPECPKAIKLESLNRPVLDDEGNVTELGDLIADDKALDLAEWTQINTFLLGCPDRLIAIAEKIRQGEALTKGEHCYIQRFRKREQQKLF